MTDTLKRKPTSEFEELRDEELLEIDGGVADIMLILKGIGVAAAGALALYQLGKGVGEALYYATHPVQPSVPIPYVPKYGNYI
jgi:lactobin A/cerein 7B family class IIb bacteriocin